ncbi:zinc finger protein ZAT1-like [Solanum dulcamara]|uniref:zinc finger protein ZAT1-like n=1 Tax=Solanum dulcamara TaxID=45834 RepID=UPI0024853748|nr:zinc finger protein ZAT1-like [Solanum dulcamara]
MISMSMEKHKCKLCSKRFLSGKALGGHMRSHLIPLPLPPKTPPLNQDSGGRTESTLSLCSSENQEDKIVEEKDFYYGLRENPKKSFRMIDPEFLDDGFVVQDRESETESEKNSTNRSRRSKRSRRMVENDERIEEEKVTDFGSLSLYSDDADIAMCLMMLSRDVTKLKPKYQCGICYKMFKTSQALGSHKTIHKNKHKSYEEEEEAQKISSKRKLKLVASVDQKLHECLFCGKFFQSGQALGGHKRSHLVIMSSSTTTGSCSSTKLGDSLMEYSNSANLPNEFIDLNMPAPLEDNDFFQQEFA